MLFLFQRFSKNFAPLAFEIPLCQSNARPRPIPVLEHGTAREQFETAWLLANTTKFRALKRCTDYLLGARYLPRLGYLAAAASKSIFRLRVSVQFSTGRAGRPVI